MLNITECEHMNETDAAVQAFVSPSTVISTLKFHQLDYKMTPTATTSISGSSDTKQSKLNRMK